MANNLPNPKRQVQVFIETQRSSYSPLASRAISQAKTRSRPPCPWIENAPQHIGLFENVGRHQQFLLASARAGDINSREHSFIRNLAIENNFRIAGSLEFFEIASSIREPVSISAVAIIVSDPPFSMFPPPQRSVSGIMERISINATGQNLAR